MTSENSLPGYTQSNFNQFELCVAWRAANIRYIPQQTQFRVRWNISSWWIPGARTASLPHTARYLFTYDRTHMEPGQASLPGGVQASSGDWTKAERLFVGMGRAIFSSLCLASAACTASVWMSAQPVRMSRVSHTGEEKRGDGEIFTELRREGTRIKIALVHDFISCIHVATVCMLYSNKTELNFH